MNESRPVNLSVCSSAPTSHSGTKRKFRGLLIVHQRLRQHRLQQPPALLIGLAELLLQLVAEGHQFIHLGDDAVLFGEGWNQNRSRFNLLPDQQQSSADRSIVLAVVLSFAILSVNGRKSFTIVWFTSTLRSARKRIRFFCPAFHSRQMI